MYNILSNINEVHMALQYPQSTDKELKEKSITISYFANFNSVLVIIYSTQPKDIKPVSTHKKLIMFLRLAS